MKIESILATFGLASLLIIVSTSSAFALTLTWDGSFSADWTKKQNWGNNTSIAAGDDLVFAGTTRLTNNNDTSAGTSYNSITFSSSAGAFVLNGNSMTLGVSITNNSTSLQTINLDLILSGNRTITTTSGNITIGGVISGSTFGITKLGAATLTLTNANTYTGTTTVSGGKLTVSSSGLVNFTVGVTIGAGEFNYNSATALSKPVTFNLTGGSLSGIGTITQAVTLSSGNTYSAGALGDPGTQAFTGGLTLASGSIFSWDLDATTTDPGANTVNSGSYDMVTGNGTGTGTFKVVLGSNSFTDVFWNTHKTWNNIFSGSDPTFSVFAGTGVATNGLVSGEGQFTYTGSTLTWTAVPEPNSAVAGILLGAGMLRRKRNQRQSA